MPQANVPCCSSGVGGPAGPRPELPLGLVSRDPLPICPTGWHLNCLQFLKGLCNSVPSSVYLAFWLTAPPSPHPGHTVTQTRWAAPISGPRGEYMTLTCSQMGRSAHLNR